MSQTTVLVGFLGSVLDAAPKGDRWRRWRPTIGICSQEELLVGRFYLLYGPGEEKLCRELVTDLAAVSPETEVIPRLISVRNRWDFEEVFGVLLDFARTLEFDLDRENWLVHITTGTHVEQICLFLLTESHHFPAQLVQTAPPKRSHGKTGPPSGRFQIIDLDLSRYDRLAGRFADERLELASLLKSGIATRNERFNRLIDQIERVASGSKSPILLTGATGVGKTRLARQIYELKRRKQGLPGPLVEVNAATLRGEMAASALFGHIKGAFTGALAERAGFLRAADGGVLFLDEIGELGLGEQSTLLRAIEEKRFRPVGSDREVTSDFSLIAGTNRNLTDEIRAGRFREDLLARIDLWTFRLPGLSERREDIAPNIDYELTRFAAETGTNLRFHPEALATFLRFAVSSQAKWPANFRDLRAAIFRMGTLADGGRISAENVAEEIARLREEDWQKNSGDDSSVTGNDAEDAILLSLLGKERLEKIDRFDRVTLAAVLRVCQNARSLSSAGRTLFDVSRQTKKSTNDADRLRKFLARFGLDWETVHSSRRIISQSPR